MHPIVYHVMSGMFSFLSSALFSPLFFFFPSPLFVVVVSSLATSLSYGLPHPSPLTWQSLQTVCLTVANLGLPVVMLKTLGPQLFLGFVAYSSLLGNLGTVGGLRTKSVWANVLVLGIPLVLLIQVSLLLGVKTHEFLFALWSSVFLAKFPLTVGLLERKTVAVDHAHLGFGDAEKLARQKSHAGELLLAAGVLLVWSIVSGELTHTLKYPFWNSWGLWLVFLATCLSPALSFMAGASRINLSLLQTHYGGVEGHPVWALLRDMVLISLTQLVFKVPVFPQHVLAIILMHFFGFLVVKKAAGMTTQTLALNAEQRNVLSQALVLMLVLSLFLLAHGGRKPSVLHGEQSGLEGFGAFGTATGELKDVAKPRGAIYMLAQRERLDGVLLLLLQLDRNFNDRYDYPVVIFHEDFLPEDEARVLGSVRSRVQFEPVAFEIPDFIDRSLVGKITNCSSHSVGYRHMCRFHAGLVINHSALRPYDWVWRLDDDSHILSEMDFDIFRFMEANDYSYGYLATGGEPHACVAGLWELASEYADSEGLPRDQLDYLYQGSIYYNNFEVLRLAVFRDKVYQGFFEAVDRAGGIYFQRWGDAPIKTLGVTLAIPNHRLHYFSEVHYKHQHVVSYPTYFDWLKWRTVSPNRTLTIS